MFHGVLGVGRIVRAKPIGFVVGHVITAIVLERQVDKALEHSVEQHRFGGHTGHAAMGVLAHQFVEGEHVDGVTGKPELHLDLVLLQAAEGEAVVVQGQRRLQQVLQPAAEGDDPAFPVAAVTACAHGFFDGLGRHVETFFTGPFQQAVKEGAGVRAAWETMNIPTGGERFPRGIGVEAFVIEQLLGLWAFGRFKAGGAHAVADAQGAVGGNPPVFRGLAYRQQRREQGRLIARRVEQDVLGVGHKVITDGRAALLQVQQPARQTR